MHATKIEMRRHVLVRRDLVQPAEARAAAAAVSRAGLVLARDRAPSGAPIAAYWPIRSEISTRPLMDTLADAGFQTALPVTRATGQPLDFRLWISGDDLARGPLGIAEPLARASSVRPVLLFIPLAAFDSRGGRIGYGAGHYDATLTALRTQGPLVAIGLAYDLQELEAVPLETHDQLLDYVITETRTLATGAD